MTDNIIDLREKEADRLIARDADDFAVAMRRARDVYERHEAHVMKVTYAGFHCTCGRWKIGSWNGVDEAFAAHVEREGKRR